MSGFFSFIIPLFISVFNLSLNAVWVILFIAAARLIFKKAPRGMLCALWGVAAFRLVCPVSFSAVFSLLPAARTVPTDLGQTSAPAIHSGIPLVDNAVNPLLPPLTTAPGTNALNIFLTVCATVWLFGFFIFAAYCAISIFKLCRRLKCAVRCDFYLSENILPRRAPMIFICSGLKTAFVTGIFTPKIYLPVGLTDKQREYILCHECMHIRRLDYIFKPLAFIIMCVHWFNPFVWLAFCLLGRDMEMACDEAVIRTLGSGAKKEYSSALLSLAAERRQFTATPLAFGEGNVKGRIKNVLSYKKPSFWLIILSVVALGVLAVCLLANPVEPDNILDDSSKVQSADSGSDFSDNTPPGNISAAANGNVSAVFPAYQDGKTDYNASVYDTPPFTADFKLPDGWSLAVPSEPQAGAPWTSLNIYNSAGALAGTVGFGIFDDVPELAAEEFYKAAFAELRLSSMAVWCNDYTPIRTESTQQTAISTCSVSEAYLSPDYSGDAAAAEFVDYPAVTLWNRDLCVYVVITFSPGSITDEQLTAVAESLILQGGAQANG